MDGFFKIQWLNKDARGSVDLIDGAWLSVKQKKRNLFHPTRHAEGVSRSTFDLVPDGDALLFRYGGDHAAVNEAERIFIGDMRIMPDFSARTTTVGWRRPNRSGFEQLPVRVRPLIAREGGKRATKGTRLGRSSELAAWKRAWAKAEGKLQCKGCGTSGDQAYGQAAENIFEVHHVDGLSRGERDTVLPDLALLCANCHRAIHALGDLPLSDFLARF